MDNSSGNDSSFPYRSLLNVELGSIQRYITESSKLREIRGASALLDETNRVYVRALIDQRFEDHVAILRSSGGVTMLGVHNGAPAGLEEELTDAVLRLYRTRIPGAAVYHAWVSCEQETDVRALLARLSYETARRQGSVPEPDAEALPMEPLIRYCDSCGLRAAVHLRRLGDDADLICSVCQAKDKHGLLVRNGKTQGSALARFAKFVEEWPDWQDVNVLEALPDDLSALADTAPNKDLALILADGNRLGQTLRVLNDFDQYVDFSEGVARVVEEAVFEALARHLPRGSEDEPCLPWEIIFMGGDDVLLVTAADIALPVALHLMRSVEQRSIPLFESLRLERKKLSMAAGVAMAAAHYPFSALHKLAQQLEDSAKKKAYAHHEQSGEEASAVDFHRLTASGRTTLNHIRRIELRPRRFAAEEAISLTMRPYTLGELEKVVRLARAWHGDDGRKVLPRHKIHFLRERLFESPAEAMFAWAHVVGRARPDERRLWQQLDALSSVADGPSTYYMPWIVDELEPASPSRATYLLDVIDLLGILPRSPKSADAS